MKVKRKQTSLPTLRKPVASEHQEQAAVVKWAALMCHQWPELRLLFAVPNAAKRSPRLGAWMKAEGMQAGIPDLWLPVARKHWRVAQDDIKLYHGLAIEMKRVKGGRTSDAQKRWITALREQGYCVQVCAGSAEAIAVLRQYLGA